MKRKFVSVVAVSALLLSSGSAAVGLSYAGTKYGGEIHAYGKTISLRDNQNDHQFPSVNYTFDKRRQKGGFSNKSGYETTVYKTVSHNVEGIQPCVSRPGPLPSRCGGWIGSKPK